MRLLASFFLLLLGSMSWARADEVRLAVIAPDDPDFAALATVELAKLPGVVVLERAEITKIAKEETLAAAARDDSWTSLGQLLHADALLIVSRNDLFGTPLGMARLVAVQPGVVVDSATLAPEPASLPSEAARIVGQFGPLLSKLDSLDVGSAVKVSLLGLHFDANSPMATGSERVLNALLADRLTHRPHILVLERWNLDAAAWEKGIEPETPSPFWTGSCLVDGRIAEQGSNLQIELRLRLADEDKPILISVTQPANQVAELADALAGQIAAALGVRDGAAASSWDRKEEALNETLLAHWALGNHLYPDAFAAVATANALCPRTPDIELLRLESETQLAFPHPPLINMNGWTPYNAARDGVPTPAQCVAAQAALDHLETLWPLCADDPVFKPAAGRFYLQAMYTVQQVSRLLAAIHDDKSWHEDAVGLGDLRQGVRDNVDRLLQLDLGHQSYAYVRLSPYIPYWFETPEETVAFYRRLLQLPGNPAFPFPWRYPLARGSIYRPWLVGWHGEDPAKLTATWNAFLETLQASSSLQDQVAGWAWKINSAPYAERAALLPVLADFAWKNRAEIARADSTTDLSPIGDTLSDYLWQGANQDPSIQKLATDLLPYLFQANTWIRPRTLYAFGLVAVRAAPQEKEKLASQFAAYRTAMAGSPFLDASSKQELDAVTGAVFGAAPAETAGAAETHFSAHFLDLAGADGVAATVRDPVAADGHFWFIDAKLRRIVCWDPVGNIEASIPYDPAMAGAGLDLAVGSRYLFIQVSQQIWEYDRSTQLWTHLDLPLARYAPATTGAHAALLYWQPTGEKENGGLLALDPAAHTTETVLSARSNPPRNELDGLPESRGMSLHLTEDGRIDYVVKLSASNQTTGLRGWSDSRDDLYTQKQPGGPWERVLSVTSTFTRVCHLAYYPEPQGALLLAHSRLGSTRSGTFCQLILWDRDSGKQTLLLANPAAEQPPLPGVAQWEMPEDLAATETLLQVAAVPALQDGVLWVLRWEGFQEQGSQRAEVYRFKPGVPKGERLVLDFDPPQGVPAGENEPKELLLRPINVVADATGFILARNPEAGAWYLPFSEMNAALDAPAKPPLPPAADEPGGGPSPSPAALPDPGTGSAAIR